MEEQHILDSVVREALKATELGDFSRSTFFGRREGRSYIDSVLLLGRREYAKIEYTLGNIVVVRGDCFTTRGMKRKNTPEHIITERDRARYEKACEAYRQKEDRENQKKTEAWENAKQKGLSRTLHPPLAGHRVYPITTGVVEGVLVDSYKDKEWRTAQFERVVIQYVHPDAVMNIDTHKQATRLTGETLLGVMDGLQKKYGVETGYLNDRELRNYHHDGRIGSDPTDLGPMDKEQQNNVFQKELKGRASVDDIVAAIKSVYAAGEAFREGIQKLREERKREEEARKSVTYTAFGV